MREVEVVDRPVDAVVDLDRRLRRRLELDLVPAAHVVGAVAEDHERRDGDAHDQDQRRGHHHGPAAPAAALGDEHRS